MNQHSVNEINWIITDRDAARVKFWADIGKCKINIIKNLNIASISQLCSTVMFPGWKD